MSDYLEIKIFDKIYTQRTKFGKIQEFSHDGVKIQSYDEAPDEIKKIISTTEDIEEHLYEYFDCEYLPDGGIRINKAKPKIYEYNFVKIPEFFKNEPIVEIGRNIFENPIRNSIKQIQLPETILRFSESSFNACNGLLYINIPSKVKTLPSSCFKNCAYLKNINLSNIEEIGTACFKWCFSLKEIDLSNATHISNSAFYRCTSLKTIKLSDKLTVIPDYFAYRCKNLENLILPDSIEVIGKDAFNDCQNYNPEKMPANLRKINENAFKKCAIKSFITPQNLEKISSDAFCDSNLKHLEITKTLARRLTVSTVR